MEWFLTQKNCVIWSIDNLKASFDCCYVVVDCCVLCCDQAFIIPTNIRNSGHPWYARCAVGTHLSLSRCLNFVQVQVEENRMQQNCLNSKTFLNFCFPAMLKLFNIHLQFEEAQTRGKDKCIGHRNLIQFCLMDEFVILLMAVNTHIFLMCLSFFSI